MNTIKVNVATGEQDYSRRILFTQKEVDINSLTCSELIRFLNTSMEEICKDKALWELYTALREQILYLEDKELSFLYATGGATSGTTGIGEVVLLKEIARRFYNRSQKQRTPN